MLQILARNWWMVALRGVAAIIFGILAIIWPDIAVGVLVAFFGAYALVDGIFAIVAAFRGEDTDRWWHVAQGVLGIAVGLIAWFYPGLTAVSLLYFFAAWLIVTGVLQVMAGIRLRKQINEFWLILGGVLSVIVGIIFFLSPIEALVTVARVIGIYAIIFGIVLLALAMRLRGLRDRIDSRMDHGAAPASA